jgi:hypothetical protein
VAHRKVQLEVEKRYKRRSFLEKEGYGYLRLNLSPTTMLNYGCSHLGSLGNVLRLGLERKFLVR